MVEESGFFFVHSLKESWGVETPERIGGSLTGWSEVWLVEHDGKYRVLKSLKPDYRGLPMYEGLLKKEFDIGSSLSHSNICETYAFIEHPTLGNCIEMEWVDGRSLDSVKVECFKDPLLARKIILEICDALMCIHSKQMVHQDLKPSNILVTHNGNNVKIIDFGLSLQDSQCELKISGGTKSFAAPELLEGKKADVLSDIYSLGKVIEQITPRYKKIVRKCCKHAPSERYLSVASVKEAILKKDSGKSWVLPVSIAAAVVVAVLLLMNRAKVEKPSDKPSDNAALVSEAAKVGAGQDQTQPSDKPSGDDSGKKEVKDKPQQPAKGAGQVQKEEKAKKVEVIDNETDLDDLFESVTELFEEKEGGK